MRDPRGAHVPCTYAPQAYSPGTMNIEGWVTLQSQNRLRPRFQQSHEGFPPRVLKRHDPLDMRSSSASHVRIPPGAAEANQGRNLTVPQSHLVIIDAPPVDAIRSQGCTLPNFSSNASTVDSPKPLRLIKGCLRQQGSCLLEHLQVGLCRPQVLQQSRVRLSRPRTATERTMLHLQLHSDVFPQSLWIRMAWVLRILG